MPADPAQRLQKIIAAAGIASRRKAEELIAEGRVQVNGQTVTELGTKADPARDHIRVDGKLLHGAERPRYYLLNKPRGYVTTASDPEGRPTVIDLIRGGERVFPVGRLDYSSEGLLLMTNDGALANALTRTAARVEKTYLVKVSGQPSDSAISQLRQGVMIDRSSQISPTRPTGSGARPAPKTEPRGPRERVMTAPARIRLLREGENPWYEMILIEGRNREIRKMFEEVGHHVEKIRRVGYGPLVLDVEPGRYRELTPDELESLRRAASDRPTAASPRPTSDRRAPAAKRKVTRRSASPKPAAKHARKPAILRKSRSAAKTSRRPARPTGKRKP